jgi:hypothetical protein
MKFLCAILIALLAYPSFTVSLSSPKQSGAVDRRNALLGAGVGAVTFLFPLEKAVAKESGAAAFVGTYSDPINHPGGKRTIKLLDSKVGDYQLAEVIGGGGIGEPKNYVLPAAVIGDRTIVIDFSPKGGPRDFVGVLEGNDIKFLKDGNRWPRL